MMDKKQLQFWARWVMQCRMRQFPFSSEEIASLYGVCDRLFKNAEIARAESFMDVGAGDGFMAFQALLAMPEHSTVTFSDVSPVHLQYCQDMAEEMGYLQRCRFICTAADNLMDVHDKSMDVITTRSVLHYVKDTQKAFHEFFRILKEGGRLALFEPMGRYLALNTENFPQGISLHPSSNTLTDILKTLQDAYRDLPPSILNFNEKDLFLIAERAGFSDVRLEIEKAPQKIYQKQWEEFIHGKGPAQGDLSLGEMLSLECSEKEKESLLDKIHQIFSQQASKRRHTIVYLSAKKI